ncbi:MAG TPA: hypothetical protein VGF67_02550 [Ktedonobacteraceae bacterium]
MTRSLYRFYLYAMFVALVIFATSATAQVLTTLFTFTPLRGAFESAPSQAALVQALVFAIVGWLITGTLGGLHYWLIRRDLHSEPAAGASPIRAFFLNATAAGGTLLVVPLIGFVLIENWALHARGDVAYAAGIAVPTLLMVALFTWERGRTPLTQGAALIFQRLHLFGVQLLLLSFLSISFLDLLRPLVNGLFSGGQIGCGPAISCPSYNLAGLALTLLWFVCCWLLYGQLTRQDVSRPLRLIMHGVSLAIGCALVLVGVFVGLELVLSPLFHLPVGPGDVLGPAAGHDFVSPLLTGILIAAVSHWLLRDLSRRRLLDQQTRRLTEWSIVTTLLAATFWWGCASLLYSLLQTIAPTPIGPESQTWITTIALIATGLSYVPLDLLLRQGLRLGPTTAGPRRGLVLALLGASILALAIGGATALYAWLTALLGSPLSNWPQTAHIGIAAAIIGALVAGFYLWTMRQEQLFTHHPTQAPTPTPAAEPQSIEGVLDELLAGKIGRDEAAARLRTVRPLLV